MDSGKNGIMKAGLIVVVWTICLICGSSYAEAAVKIQWSEDKIEISLAAGNASQQETAITSNENLKDVDIEAVPSIAGFVSINPSHIGDLHAGQPQSVALSFAIPSDTALGTYGGTVHVLSGSRTIPETLKIKITVTESEEPEGERPSPANVVLDGACESCFNPTSALIRFVIEGETLSSHPQHIKVFRNGRAISESLYVVSPNEVSCAPILKEGRNDITFYALDSKELMMLEDYTFWAGSRTIRGTIRSEEGVPVDGATVTALLGDNQNVQETSTTDAGGQFQFDNMPGRTIIFEASADGNRHGSAAANGAGGYVHMTMLGFNEPSDIPNNDFSMGTLGWNIGNSPVTIVPHDEPEALITQDSMKKRKTHKRSASQQGENMDLRLQTSGEGPRSVSRTFRPEAGTRVVSVRYRFITTEVPGGYFGTAYNDYFNITIRSLGYGDLRSENKTMNEMGRAAFDDNGATAWMETSLRVNEGDAVQVDMTVANVGDGWLDSFLEVDMIAERRIAITELALHDIDGATLQYLSAAPHPYFDGNTRVHGTITVEGPENDSLSSLTLEILQNGAVVATAELDQTAEAALYQPFGDDETVDISTSQLLFNLSSGEAANVDDGGGVDCTLGLRVRASSENGDEVTENSGPVELLILYNGGGARYLGRNENEGGDDWAKPPLNYVVSHFDALYGGFQWGDFSNMNGGYFSPHTYHQNGNDVDGFFPGYSMNANTANLMIQYLNDPTCGSMIEKIYLTYNAIDGNAVWDAIKNVTLNDGRLARNVILNSSGHTGHFHWKALGILAFY